MAIPLPFTHLRMFPRGLARLALLGAFFAVTTLNGQNLIRNPSFEDFNHFVFPITEVLYLDTFPNPNARGLLHWWNPTIPELSYVVSDSLINSGLVFDSIRPKSGQALIGLTMGNTQKRHGLNTWKNFYQSRLRDTLEKGCWYAYRMFYYADNQHSMPPHPVDSNAYATNDLGAYFSSHRITDRRGSDTNNVPYQKALSMRHFQDNHNIHPQVQTSGQYFLDNTGAYQSLSDTFQAAGGEKYLTIGSFRPAKDIFFKNLISGQVVPATDTQTIVSPGLYVDDLSLISLPPLKSMLNGPGDTLLCPSDTITLSATSPDSTYGFRWDDGSRGAQRDISAPGTYWVELVCPCQKTLRDTFVVEEATPLPDLKIADTTVCANQGLKIMLPEKGQYLLNGQAVSGQPLTVADSGQFVLTARGPCKVQEEVFRVKHRPSPELPQLNLQDTSLCRGQELDRKLPESFSYTLNGRNIQENSLSLRERRRHRLVASHACDSVVYDFEIHANGCEPIVFVPNAFTPDGDGLNDCFKVSVKQYQTFHLEIYNRWGQKIFESAKPSNCWDGRFKGKPVSGVYHYRLVINNHGAGEEMVGTVMVLR